MFSEKYMDTPSAKLMTYSDKGRVMFSRLKLVSGEQIYIKVILDEMPFAGIWQYGSLNPVTVLIDWMVSWFTKKRTAGLIQIWGLNASDVGGSDKWFEKMKMFNPIGFNEKGQKGDVLSSMTSTFVGCQSIEDVLNELGKRIGDVEK